MQFEVQIPKRNNPEHLETLVVESPNWLFALRDGLKQLGDSMETRNIVCEILGDNVVEVIDPTSDRTFSVKEMVEGATFTKSQSVPITPAVPAGATEAFIPPVNFFEQAAESAGAVTAQTPPESMAVSEAPGEPVGVMAPPSATVVESPDDMPFAVANVAPSDALPEEDLAFSAPMPIVSESSAGRPVASKLAAVEQLAVVEEPVIPKEPLPGVPVSSAKPEPPKATPKPKPPKPSPTGPIGLSISGVAGGGKYSPGMTTEILADAFMRAMEIYDYGEDRHAAMQFVLDLALNNVAAAGGAVLLTDINSPNQELWFEVASGPKADELLNFRIPMGQGIIGYCAKEGVSQLIADPAQEPRYENDVLNQVGLRPGSILAVPVQHQKRMLGTIVMFNHTGERPFTQGELSILNYLAHTAGEYLINLV